jgi:hypothetical protein
MSPSSNQRRLEAVKCCCAAVVLIDNKRQVTASMTCFSKPMVTQWERTSQRYLQPT